MDKEIIFLAEEASEGGYMAHVLGHSGSHRLMKLPSDVSGNELARRLRRYRLIPCSLWLWLTTFPAPWLPLAAGDAIQAWTLRDSIGHDWKRELVSYALDAPVSPGDEARYGLEDEAGKPVPFQLERRPGPGGSPRVFLTALVDLSAYSRRTLTLRRGRNRAAPPAEVQVEKEKGFCVLSSGRLAVRVGRPARFKPGTPFEKLPPPILAVRGVSGRWLGEGGLSGSFPVQAFETEIEARGPLYAQARLRYEFGGRSFYQVRVRVVSGEDVVLVEEDFALPEEELKRTALAQPPDLAPPLGQSSNLSDWLVGRGMGWKSIPAAGTTYPAFRFHFFRNWKPDRVRAHNYLAARETYQKEDLTSAQADWTLGLVLTPFQERGFRLNALAFESDAEPDYLGLFYRFLSRWDHPNENRVLLPWLDDGVCGQFTVFEGRREWGLFAAEPGPQHRDDYGQKGGPRHYGPIHRVHVKFGETPLDKVKDWILEWDVPPDAAWPRLFLTPEGIERARKEFPNLPLEIRKVVENDRLTHALLTGDRATLRSAFEAEAEGYVRVCIADFLEGGHHTLNTYTHRYQEIVRTVCHTSDLMMACPDIPPDARRRFLARIAFLAYKTSDPDYWAYHAYGGGPSNPNMMSIACNAVASAAALLPGHPMRADWLRLCHRLVAADILNSIGPKGAWLESPGYQGAGNEPINQTVLILRNAGIVDLAADPESGRRLLSVSRYFANLLTPPDPRFGGLRKPVALGDGDSYGGADYFTYLAYSGRNTFPTEAGNALWCWQQMGRPAHAPAILVQEHVLDAAVTPVPIEGRSEFYPDFGAILRHGFGHPAETFMTYHQSGFSYGHYDDDLGSFSLHAKGVPLCLDWISYSPNEAEFHNRVDYHPDDYPWTVDPPDPFISHAEADYLRSWENGVYTSGHSRPIEPGSRPDWQRQTLLIKDVRDPGDATYLVFRDVVHAARPSTWNLWTMARKGSERIDGNLARLEGQFGVDVMLCFYRKPSKPLESRFHSHPMPGYVNYSFKSQDQTRIQASSDSGGDYGVVLYPLRRGMDAEPEVRELPSGVVELKWPGGRRHLLFLFPESQEVFEAGLHFKGRSAVAKWEKDVRILVPLDCERFEDFMLR